MTIDDEVPAVLLLEFRRPVATSPLMMEELPHSAFFKVFEKTCFRISLIRRPYRPV